MIFKYFIVGLVQGLTEFLPVSSSGHIVLLSYIFNLNCDIILLSVVVHIATLLSVIICMRKTIKQLITNPFCNTNKKLMIATIPTIIIVVLFKNQINKLYGINIVIYGFLITGMLLLLADLFKPKYEFCNKKSAFLMGVMQGIAILPGISRSGSTMAVGMMNGVKKEKACEFTFLMSIPIIMASGIYEGVGLLEKSIEIAVLPLLIAFVTAFICGIISIKFMFKILNKNKLYVFSIYLILVAIIGLIVYIFG